MSKATLLDVITQHVECGTINTDGWKGFSGLSHHNGYIHETVNHKLHFKDPETEDNTQNIESAWRDVR